MVAPHPRIREKIKNTRKLIKKNQSHLVPGLVKDRPDQYLDLKDYTIIDRLKPWAESSAPAKATNLKKLQTKVYDKILILCADFSDRPSQTPLSTITNRFFSTTFNEGYTFINYYAENSFLNFIPQGEVHGWYRAPKTASYYVDQDYGFGKRLELINDILDIAATDPTIDWQSFDANNDEKLDYLIIVHAGDEAASSGSTTDFWAHVGGMYTKTIYGKSVDIYALVSEYITDTNKQVSGVDCHEFGHLLGLPDLYDYDGDSYGAGYWSVMAHGSWANGGKTPVHFDIWSKFNQGWINPMLNRTGSLTLRNIENYPDTVVYTTSVSGEFFIIENRQKLYFDYYLPSSGILIWKVNEYKLNNNDQACYKVGLVQADGQKHLELQMNAGDSGDPYPGSYSNRKFSRYTIPSPMLCSGTVETNINITDITDSSTTMSFQSQICQELYCELIVN